MNGCQSWTAAPAGRPPAVPWREDIVRGYAQETDCIFKLRERITELARGMIDLDAAIKNPAKPDEE